MSDDNALNVAGSQIKDNFGWYGGGVYFVGTGSIFRSTIEQNVAELGAGGMFLSSQGAVGITVDQCAIDQNSATGNGGGGGLYISGSGLLTVRDSSITENNVPNASTGGGGALVLSYCTISGSQIVGNSTDGIGGGLLINVIGIDPVLVESSLIAHNMAAGDGGGIFASNGLIQYSQIEYNTAGDAGGGVVLESATLRDSRVTGNTAGTSGGGVHMKTRLAHRPQPELRNVTIDSNSAVRGGGVAALVAHDIASLPLTVSIMHATISNNSASLAGGGLDVAIGRLDAFQLSHSTIVGNRATSGGGLLLTSLSAPPGERGSAVVSHTIVAHNLDTNSANGNRVDIQFNEQPALHHNLIGNRGDESLTEAPLGSPDANGNLIGGPDTAVIDPRLGPLADNGGPTKTHALLPGSPAIEAGDPSIQFDENGFDQRGSGYFRVFDGDLARDIVIDIGAYESQGIPVGYPLGDYNRDGIAGSADYVLWRNTRGQMVEPGSGADGDGDGMIGDGDLELWRTHFGNTQVQLAPALSNDASLAVPLTAEAAAATGEAASAAVRPAHRVPSARTTTPLDSAAHDAALLLLVDGDQQPDVGKSQPPIPSTDDSTADDDPFATLEASENDRHHLTAGWYASPLTD
jgi:hypothetical protein